MDELEEFLTVFFQECEERLGELQDCLSAMASGDSDSETLNAAFRAVHSVKGGAGAFGLDELVEFTHVFETTMDALRSDKLEPTDAVLNVLLRASDTMSALIEKAQGAGDAVDAERRDALMRELEALANGEAIETPAPAPAPAAAPASDAPAVEAAEADDDAEPAEREVSIALSPGPDFIRSGHDPLKVIRALKRFGSVRVAAAGDHPQIDEIDPMETSLSWTISLETAADVAELETFLMIYTMTADVVVTDTAAEEAGEEAAEEAGDASDAPAAEAPAAAQPAQAETAATTRDEPTPDAAASQMDQAEALARAEAEAKAAIEAAERKAQEKAKAAEGSGGAPVAQHKVAKALRVELSRIDRLVNMVGEIVITQAVLAQNFSEAEAGVNVQAAHAVEALSRQTRELQESVMAIRAQPVKSVFSRMPRVVRDLCTSLDKDVRIELAGEHTEVDTTVIEELSEPLTHMLRNSMDHGIESPEKRESVGKPRQGVISLYAEHRGERVRIVLEDDGAGINRERVFKKAVEKGIVAPDAALADEEIDQLIFHPGFSTASEVTNVSGRGVGMDVVKKKVQALGGRVGVVNTPGKGAQFAITLPLTLAVLDGMTVGAGEERFILPLSSVVEAVKVDGSNLDTLPGGVRVLRYRGEWLPIIDLDRALNMDSAHSREDLVVVVETETDGRVAIVVDELLGQRQVVLKSLEANFRRVEGVSGATILGDGRVALILDVPALASLGGAGGRSMSTQEFAL